MKGDLVQLIKKIYDEDSSYRGSPPWQLLQGLEKNRLIISDCEVADVDIPVLAKFFQTKQACKEVQVIEINRTCGASVYRRRNSNSALNAADHKLMKELLQFISKCQHLQMLTFHMVKLGVAFMSALGKALTLSQESELRWLVFNSCHIGGDAGLREITVHLCSLPLQVLALESCKLTDASWPYIASIIKARESCLDDCYWNSTLRADNIGADGMLTENKQVLGDGLVAISLRGNLLEGKNMDEISTLLKKTFWLLGLNLADNKLSQPSISILSNSLRMNEVIQVLLLKNNPGSAAGNLREIYHTIASHIAQSQLSSSHEDKRAVLISGYSRIELLPARVAWLLRTWMELQYDEALVSHHAPSQSQDIEEAKLKAKAYNGLEFCLEPTLADPNHSLRQSQDAAMNDKSHLSHSAPVLYDLPLNGSTTKIVHTPFHDYLFTDESNPAVQQKSTLVSSLDISDQDSGIGEERDLLEHGLPSSHSKGDNPQGNGLDSELDWEYWPEERTRSKQSEYNQRPPSRVSMRPKPIFQGTKEVHRVPNTAPVRRSQSPHPPRASTLPRYMLPKDAPWRLARDAADHRNRKIPGLNKPGQSTSPNASPLKQRHWVPSAMLDLQRSISPEGKALMRSKSAGNTPTKVRPVDISQLGASRSRMYKSTDHFPSKKEAKRVSPAKAKVDKSKEKEKKKAKTKTKKSKKAESLAAEMKALTTLSNSVLKATKSLEHVSDRLKHVALSLSESALLNISTLPNQESFHASHMQTTQIPTHTSTNNQAAKSSHRYSSQDVSASQQLGGYSRKGNAEAMPVDLGDLSFASTIRTSVEAPGVNTSVNSAAQSQLADIVRQRMQSKLRSILSQELGQDS